MMAAQGDPEVYGPAQVAIGLNPRCEMIGASASDEGVWGTVRVGISSSALLGGRVQANALMWRPTLALGGQVILGEG